jgi:putative ABC transport system permease protein
MILTSLKNLSRDKTRSFLTSLGILIGVAAVVSLVSISEGIKVEANTQIGNAEYIKITQKTMMSTLSILDESIIDRVSRIQDVEYYTKEIDFYLKSFNNQELSATSTFSSGNIQMISGLGIEPQNAEYFKNAQPYHKVSQGRMLQRNEDNSLLINSKLANDNNLFIGNSVNIDNKNFRIVGIFDVQSNFAGSGLAIMTLKSARELSTYGEEEYSSLLIISSADTKKLSDRLEEIFPDNRITSSQQSAQSLNSFLSNLSIALWFVSSISALVGGVGIMNTMLMSVMERIKEFGVLKAIGWQNKHIIKMIIYEAILLGLIGGLGGLFLGVIGSVTVQVLTGIPTMITLELIIEALGFSILIGILSSLYPAVIASRMSPVEAVRFE